MAKKNESLLDSILMKGQKQSKADKAFGEWIAQVFLFIGGFIKDIAKSIGIGAVKTLRSNMSASTFWGKIKRWISYKNKNCKLLIPFIITIIVCIKACMLFKYGVWSIGNLEILFFIMLPIEFLFLIGIFDVSRPFRMQNVGLILVCIVDIAFLLTSAKFNYMPKTIVFKIISLLILTSPVLYVAIYAVYLVFYKKEKPNKLDEQFKEIGLKTNMGTTPVLIDTHDKGNYKIYVFKTIIPVSNFVSKKDYLENILKEHIRDIKGELGIVKVYTGEKEELKFEQELLEIGLKTKGTSGTVPLLIDCYTKRNLIGKEHTIYEFETLISASDFLSKKDELEKFLCNDKESILSIKEKGKRVKIYVGKQEQEKIDWKDEYNRKDTIFRIGLNNILTKLVEIDIDDRHILLAGGSGSGKSTLLRLFVWLCYLKGFMLSMIDFKDGAEFNQDCRKLGKVTTTREGFLNELIKLDEEATKRNKLFSAARVTNMKDFNKITETKLKRIVLFCDELATPLDITGADKDIKETALKILFYLSELARKGRSAGIHLILCMQRPDAEVLKGQIKNNLLIRLCGRFPDESPSRIVLGNSLAAILPKINGRMILDSDIHSCEEIQTFWFDLNEQMQKSELLFEEKADKEEVDHEEPTNTKVNLEKGKELMKATKAPDIELNDISHLFDNFDK